MVCPSCDSKRAVVESSHALDELLPAVPYRQWVLVLPKRLRYFVHRDPSLPGEISRILAETLTDFYRRRCAAPKDAAPAQFHVLQRFGSSVNLHLHDHAVVSDGSFSLAGGVLRFYPAPPLDAREIEKLVEGLRRRILKRMLRLQAIPEASAAEMLLWPHSGFSLDGGTCVEAEDRAALERLLLYVLRPAFSLKQLTYKPEVDLVRYHTKNGGHGGGTEFSRELEWSGVEFVKRVAALVPPARRHMVRYYGALGPRSPLREAVSSAARGKSAGCELEAGYSMTLVGTVARSVKQAARAGARKWAACLRRIFEVDPMECACGGGMELAAVILDDGELSRILAHQGWAVGFPRTKASRSPPGPPDADEGGQLDPRGEEWEGRQDSPLYEPA